MAKKRTQLHGYGKVNQRLDAKANAALKVGDRKGAAQLSEKSSKMFYARRAIVGNGRGESQ